MPGPEPKPPAVRFVRHVNEDGPVVRPELGPCHLWTGAQGGGSKKGSPDGYGIFGWDPGSRSMRAHRAAWLIYRGPIPDGLLVLHACDNPQCVNPKHLFLGTQLDNMRDKTAKGRAVYPGRSRVLTPEQRAQAVRRAKAGEATRRIAETLGVSRGAILNAIKETRGAARHVES